MTTFVTLISGELMPPSIFDESGLNYPEDSSEAEQAGYTNEGAHWGGYEEAHEPDDEDPNLDLNLLE